MTLDGQLDWVTKRSLFGAYIDRDGLDWYDPKLSLLDLQYHDVRPDRSLYEKLVRAGKVERLVEEDDVHLAMTMPPSSDPGLFPGRVPGPLARLGGGGELGQRDPRRRLGPVATDPHDGAATRNEGARRSRCSIRSDTPAELVERLQG